MQVPTNTRSALRDTTLPRGGGPNGLSPVFVPAGKNVQYTVFVMHRDKTVWGDDVEEFRPDRWNGRKAGWDYLPFNGGLSHSGKYCQRGNLLIFPRSQNLHWTAVCANKPGVYDCEDAAEVR